MAYSDWVLVEDDGGDKLVTPSCPVCNTYLRTRNTHFNLRITTCPKCKTKVRYWSTLYYVVQAYQTVRQDVASLHSTRKSEAGDVIEIHDTKLVGCVFDPDGGRWVTYCPEHDSVCNHATLKDAKYYATHSSIWCKRCRRYLTQK